MNKLISEQIKLRYQKLAGIIQEEWNDYEQYDQERTPFSKKLPDSIKKKSHKWSGKGVTWYGDPGQMIVISKDDVYGMDGNIYDSQKLDYVKGMIEDSPENVEFECSYGLGDMVDIISVSEHQISSFNDSFHTDYEGHSDPFTTGDSELDEYLGNEYYISDNYDFDSDEAESFLDDHKLYLVRNPDKLETFKREYMIKAEPSEDDVEAMYEIVGIQKRILDAIKNNEGDLGTFKVQLRDGHHRIMGAIDSGEQYVCLNLAKDDIGKYAGSYVKV